MGAGSQQSKPARIMVCGLSSHIGTVGAGNLGAIQHAREPRMRKADYAHLAACVARIRADAMRAVTHGSPDLQHVARARLAAAEDLARDFARVASVDAAAFLKACGMG